MDRVRKMNAATFKEKHRGFTKTQVQMVYEYMIRYGSITQAEAVEAFSCYNLAERIRDLRAKGYAIVSTKADDGPHRIYMIDKEAAK